VKKAAEEFVGLTKSGKTKEEAMESCSQSRFIAAKLHTYGYIFGMFKEAIGDLESSNESKTLETVCRLFGLWVIEEQQGFFLKCESTRLT
jgi:acyl-CoA oxidase